MATLMRRGFLSTAVPAAFAAVAAFTPASEAAMLQGKAVGTWPSGATYQKQIFAPPQPLANIRVYNVSPSGLQNVTGDGRTDLLLVSPPKVIDGQFQLAVSGFRGIYFIGASFDPAPRGTMRSPTGRQVPAYPSLLRLKTSASPVSRPFIYMGKFKFDANRSKCCDFLQVGGGGKVGNWGAWPDVYRYKMLVNGNFGWSQQLGGSWGGATNHSDFMVPAMGGIRHSFAADIDVSWGYQAEFLVPGFSTNMKPYAGPDGYGENHYWNYVMRLKTDQSIGSTTTPSSFFMVRGVPGINKGEYHSNFFHQGAGQGSGVYVVPTGGRAAIDSTNPRNGPMGPRLYGTYYVWPTTGFPSGRMPVANGNLYDGAKARAPSVVSASQVGFAQRIGSVAALKSFIAAMKSGASS